MFWSRPLTSKVAFVAAALCWQPHACWMSHFSSCLAVSPIPIGRTPGFFDRAMRRRGFIECGSTYVAAVAHRDHLRALCNWCKAVSGIQSCCPSCTWTDAVGVDPFEYYSSSSMMYASWPLGCEYELGFSRSSRWRIELLSDLFSKSSCIFLQTSSLRKIWPLVWGGKSILNGFAFFHQFGEVQILSRQSWGFVWFLQENQWEGL